MHFRQRPLVAAIGFALAGAAGLPTTTHAALQSTSATAFGFASNLTAFGSSPAPGALATATTSTPNAALGTVGLDRFAPSRGVLTGVSVSVVDSSLAQALEISMRQVTGSKSSATAVGSVAVAFGAPGATLTSTSVSLDVTCATLTSGKASCAASEQQSTPVALQATPAAGVLDAYVGETGTVLVSATAPTLQVTASSRGSGTTNATGRLEVGFSGKLQATYTYLEHAAPSFDAFTPTTTLTLDFGTVVQGTAPVLDWAVYNLASAAAGVALDLDSLALSSPGGSPFDSGLAFFRDLLAGDAAHFTASLDTAALGLFETSLGLGLSDADVGVASTRASHALTLNLRALVVEAPAPVPLPAAWSVLLPGLALLGWRRRRRPGMAG